MPNVIRRRLPDEVLGTLLNCAFSAEGATEMGGEGQWWRPESTVCEFVATDFCGAYSAVGLASEAALHEARLRDSSTFHVSPITFHAPSDHPQPPTKSDEQKAPVF